MNRSKIFLFSLLLIGMFLSILHYNENISTQNNIWNAYFTYTVWADTKDNLSGHTGSISLDRSVYPVPWGTLDDFTNTALPDTTNQMSIFPIHKNSILGNADVLNKTLGNGDLVIHVRINDPDFNTSPDTMDSISSDIDNSTVGPIKISVLRDGKKMVLAYAGGNTPNTTGVIDVGDNAIGPDLDKIKQLGPIKEIQPDAGIFGFDYTIRYTDGPASELCPETMTYLGAEELRDANQSIRFDEESFRGNFCILQDDVLFVEYTDSQNVAGNMNKVTDSATFALRTGVLMSEKSVYQPGNDVTFSLIDPDLDLDSNVIEEYSFDLIGWNSDTANGTLGEIGNRYENFEPISFNLIETGESIGIFQGMIKLPFELNGNRLEMGEDILFEYIDLGPTFADHVGQVSDEARVLIFTSNFGIHIELDQRIYSWTDKVFITVIAPSFNIDSESVDEIGNDPQFPINISTRGYKIEQYKLVETGINTGIFTGEVTLTGFLHDADNNPDTGNSYGFDTEPQTSGIGPTDGFIETEENDGINVSFKFSDDQTAVGSASIKWNLGEVRWLETGYPHYGHGVVRVIDPDMNLDPEMRDKISVKIWSDSDSSGTMMRLTETNTATGIFEGTAVFDLEKTSHRNLLNVSDQDMIYAEYTDYTLPSPYTKSDRLEITATTAINPHDYDEDGIPNYLDDCPSESEVYNGIQDDDGCFDALPDLDYDEIPDLYDSCVNEPETFNGFNDSDGCPDVLPPSYDIDGDEIFNDDDNCVDQFNPNQADFDVDGIGDECDDMPVGSDYDDDGISDVDDNCPWEYNTSQRDSDNDGIGNRCDDDQDMFSFDISLEPENVLITPGKTARSVIEIRSDDKQLEKAILSCSDRSLDINCKIEPNTITPGSTSILAIETSEESPPNQHVVMITAFTEQVKKTKGFIVDIDPNNTQPPISVISSTGPYVADSPIFFSGEDSHDPDGEINEYYWDFSDGNVSSLSKLNHTYSTDGTYHVTLKVTDSEGNENVSERAIFVSPSGLSEFTSIIVIPIIVSILTIIVGAIVGPKIKKKIHREES